MPTYYIFDLDGCVSDDRHRRRFLPQSAGVNWSPDNVYNSYDEYNEWCAEDEPVNQDFVHMAHDNCVQSNGGTRLLFLTARPEKFRKATQHWLAVNFGLDLSDYLLYMRPEGNVDHSPKLKVDILKKFGITPHLVVRAYDDRQDVIDAYEEYGITNANLLTIPQASGETPDVILNEMAETFRERNAVYGDNWRVVGKVLEALHGKDSVAPAAKLVGSAEQFDVWHLWELLVVKLSRFANSGLTHEDSIHDLAVYAAMIESIIKERK